MRDYNNIKWNDIIYYDSDSPTFLRWKIEHRRGKYKQILVSEVGDVAGYIGKDGYVKVKYQGLKYQGHRIVFVLSNGSIPNDMFIDHIDGNRNNNNPKNLRVVDCKSNTRNASMSSKNKTGISGVFFDRHKNRYLVTWNDICGNKKSKTFSISKYKDAFRAACEYRLNILNELNLQGAGYSDRHLANSTLQS